MIKSKADVLAISSGGGHWIQLIRLRNAWKHYNVIYATVNRESTYDLCNKKVFVIPDANRWNKLALIKSMYAVFSLVLRVHPKIIITTGAAPGFFAVLAGRMIGSKTLWIDSLANINGLSMSGKLALRVANECITQWEELARPKRPKYKGSVI